jgi:hypothetical protein
LKTLKGAWTCPTCDATGTQEAYETCEALGHKHALKLDNGEYVSFVNNARGEALINGGGRHTVKITVVGFYDSSTHSIDVDAYQMDGQWTSWCEKDQRMDFCRSESFPSSPEAENRSN